MVKTKQNNASPRTPIDAQTDFDSDRLPVGRLYSCIYLIAQTKRQLEFQFKTMLLSKLGVQNSTSPGYVVLNEADFQYLHDQLGIPMLLLLKGTPCILIEYGPRKL